MASQCLIIWQWISLGTWADVINFGKAVDLMFDFPLNHASSAHKHFIEFLNDETPGNTYFLTGLLMLMCP